MTRAHALVVCALVAMALLVPVAARAAGEPPNDAFADATLIEAFEFTDTVDLSSASTEAGEKTCNNQPATRSVWYRFTVEASGAVVTAVSGTESTDYRLAAYSSADGTLGGLTPLRCRSGGPTNTVPVQPDVTYYVQVTDAGGGGVPLTVTLSFFATPSNDAFADAAVPPELNWHHDVGLWAASTETGEPNPCNVSSFATKRTVWYRIVAPETGDLAVTASGDGFPVGVAGYEAAGTGFAGLVPMACATDTVTLSLRPGVTYYVQAFNFSGNFGEASLAFSFTAIPRPANDAYGAATVVNSLPFSDTVDISTATTEPLEPDPCGHGITHSVWYTFAPTSNGTVAVELSGSGFAPGLTVYYEATGSGFGGLTLHGCTAARVILVPVVAGRVYHYQLSNSGSGSGLAGLSMTLVVPPQNDNLASARVVGSLPFSDTVDTRGATLETGEPRPCGGSTRTAWYRYTPVDDGVVTIDTSGSSFPVSVVTLYRSAGAGFGGLTPIACQNAGTVLVARVQAGDEYYFQAAAKSSSGTLTMQITSTPGASPTPPNDMFALATVVPGLPFNDTVDLTRATMESGESTGGCGNYFAGSVWYRFTAPADGAVTLAGSHASGTVLLNAWRASGSGLSGLQSLGVNACSGILPVTAGQTYYIQAATAMYTTPGTLDIRLALVPPPPNDDLADATVVNSVRFTDSVDIRPATKEPGEPYLCDMTSRTVWYAITANADGRVSVGAGRLWDPKVAVYRSTGPGFGGLVGINCGYVANGSLVFAVQRGITYYIQASDWYSGGTTMDIAIRFIDPVPPAISIAGGAPSYTVDGRLDLTATARDALNGPVAPTCVLTRDGTATPISTSCSLGSWAWELGLGHYTLVASATDAAGTSASSSLTFDVVSTYPAVSNLTRVWVGKAGLVKDLVALLDAAAAAESRGQVKAEAGKLAEYRELVASQSGKSVKPADAERLVAFTLGL